MHSQRCSRQGSCLHGPLQCKSYSLFCCSRTCRQIPCWPKARALPEPSSFLKLSCSPSCVHKNSPLSQNMSCAVRAGFWYRWFGGQWQEPQLVLLDHGLIVDIPDALRQQYCQLWCSFVLNDQATAAAVATQIAGQQPLGKQSQTFCDGFYIVRVSKSQPGHRAALPAQMLLCAQRQGLCCCGRHPDRRSGIHSGRIQMFCILFAYSRVSSGHLGAGAMCAAKFRMRSAGRLYKGSYGHVVHRCDARCRCESNFDHSSKRKMWVVCPLQLGAVLCCCCSRHGARGGSPRGSSKCRCGFWWRAQGRKGVSFCPSC